MSLRHVLIPLQCRFTLPVSSGFALVMLFVTATFPCVRRSICFVAIIVGWTVLFGSAAHLRAVNITYPIRDYPSLQAGWSLSGSITTDGTQGYLQYWNYLSFSVALTGPRGTNTIDSSNGLISGNTKLIATSTALYVMPGGMANILTYSGGPTSASIYYNNRWNGQYNYVGSSGGAAWSTTDLAQIETRRGILLAGYIPSGPAIVAVSNFRNGNIITGGTDSLGITVTNAAAVGADNLDCNVNTRVEIGNATIGYDSPGTLAPGSSQLFFVSATSTNLGVNTISFTASDPNSSNLSQTTNATLTVLDHSNASLSSSSNATTQTISFGNVLKGATVPSQSFTIYNRADRASAAYTTNLKLTGSTATGDAALGTDLSTFRNLTAGNGNTFTASLNTSNYTTTGSKTVTMSGAQLVDDSDLSGAGSNNNGGISITLEGNVGNATANASNSQDAFGSPLTAAVVKNASYSNLESKATGTIGSGGFGLVGSTATIKAGTNNSLLDQTVSMSWRTQTQDERLVQGLLSDVVRLEGMGINGTDQTSPFVMQMTYDPSLLVGGMASEGTMAAKRGIYLGWLSPKDGKWHNAIDGNFGDNLGSFHQGAWTTNDMTLGDWGINTGDHTVWAVLNHNSDFAVVPEPSTLVLLCAGAVGLLGWAWRKRKAFCS